MPECRNCSYLIDELDWDNTNECPRCGANPHKEPSPIELTEEDLDDEQSYRESGPQQQNDQPEPQPEEQTRTEPGAQEAPPTEPPASSQERLRFLLIYFGIPSLLLVIGSAAPWFSFYTFTASGTNVGELNWGIWTLIAGIACIWLTVNLYFAERTLLYRGIAAVASGALAILAGVFAYYVWLGGIGIFQYGWYLCVVGSSGIVAAVCVDRYKPTPREIWIASSVIFVVLVLCSLGGWQNAQPVRQAQADFEEAQEALGLSPSSPPLVPSPNRQQQRERNVALTIERYWETTQLGSGFFSRGASPDKKYLIVRVTVTNNEQDEISVYAENVQLVASDKNVYHPSTMITDSRLDRLSATLLPGGSATGDVVFEVAKSASPVSLRYSPSPW